MKNGASERLKSCFGEHYSLGFPAALRPLPTTTRAVPTSANTAIHMVAHPAKAMAKNSAFTPRASAMF